MDRALDFLYELPLFDPLSEEEMDSLEGRIGTQRYSPGEYIYYEGDPPQNFYVVMSGQIVTEREVQGKPHRLKYIYPKEFFGEAGLLNNENRSVSVKANVASEVIYIPKDVFFELIEGSSEFEQAIEAVASMHEAAPPEFPGQEPNEVVIYWGRRHWTALARQMALVIGFVIVWSIIAIATSFLVRDEPSWATWVLIFWLLGNIPLLAWGFWEYIDWSNDYHVVTDQRVLRIERVAFLTEERHEAPMDKVQEVNAIKPDAMSNWLGFGDLIIQTASLSGPIIFDSMPNPDMVAERIIRELNKAKDAASRNEQEQKRRELRRALGMEVSAEPVKVASGSVAFTKANPKPPPLKVSRPG